MIYQHGVYIYSAASPALRVTRVTTSTNIDIIPNKQYNIQLDKEQCRFTRLLPLHLQYVSYYNSSKYLVIELTYYTWRLNGSTLKDCMKPRVLFRKSDRIAKINGWSIPSIKIISHPPFWT